MKKPVICRACGKECHTSKRKAREYISRIIDEREPKKGQYALQPYRCPYKKKIYHVGRNPTVLMIDFSRKRTVNLEYGRSENDRSPETKN